MDTFTGQTQETTRERAQATVEFAMILPILCLILFAVVEFGMAFWTYQQVSAAASEGARRAAVSGTYGDRDTRVRDAARNASPGLNASSMNVTTVSTWDAGDPVTVTVTYPEDITILGATLFHRDLRVRRTSRVEQ
jgi:Flp pilus assembly protein TadG